MNTLALLAVLTLSSQAAPRVTREVPSTCRFSSSEGAVEASFKAQYLVFDEDRGREEIRIVTTLTVGGVAVPATNESCILHPRGVMLCVHGAYQLRPQVIPAGPMMDKVASVRLVKPVPHMDGFSLLGEGSCQ